VVNLVSDRGSNPRASTWTKYQVISRRLRKRGAVLFSLWTAFARDSTIKPMMDNSMTRLSLKPLPLSLAAMVLCIGSSELCAQVRSEVRIASRGAPEVVASFETMARSGRRRMPDEVRNPAKYSRARVDSVLDGFEPIALGANSPSMGAWAASVLMRAGSADQPAPRAFDRAFKVYQRSNQTAVRAMVLGFTSDQKDRARAIAFLKSVATQDTRNQDFEGAAQTAAEGLSVMGKEGRAALVDLRDRKLLRDARTRAFVRWFLST
jgi:hypothetical protein